MKKLALMTILISFMLSTVSFAGLTRKLWWNTPTGYQDIAAAWAVIDSNTEPNVVDIVADATSPQTNPAQDNYVGNLSGYLVAPVDGNYVFYVASDDDSQLLLDDVVVAHVTNWTGYLDWGNGNVSPSDPIALTAGQLVKVDMAFREGGGGDFFSIGWKLPGSSSIEVIPDAWTIPNEAGLSLALGLSPANGTTGVIDANLSWVAPPAGAEPYDVLFGTDPNNMATVAAGVTDTTYNAGSIGAELAFSTTYYWGVKTSGGTVVSSFTTIDPVVITRVSGDAELVGDPAQLSVAAYSPVGSDLTYQWHRLNFELIPGIIFPDAEVPGADANVLDIAAVSPADQGDYYVLITSPEGAVASPVVFMDAQTGLIHRWSFDALGDANSLEDSVGGADATLVNNTGLATVAGGQVTLGNDGSQSSSGNGGVSNGDYVDLPNGLISPLTQMTIECWTTWNDNTQGWGRVYDFGTSNGGEGISNAADGGGSVYNIYFTPKTGYNDNAIVEYRHGGTAPNIQPGGKLPLSQEVLITQVQDDKGDQVRLYINGIAVGGMTPLFPLNVMTDNNNWLGRSQWGDPMYVGSYDELRIYDTALSGEQIAADYLAGPDALGQLPAQIADPAPLGDRNGDGVTDFLDVAISADQFLQERIDRDAQITELQAQ